MVSLGGNKSKSFNESSTFVDPTQQPFLNNLRSSASSYLLGPAFKQGLETGFDNAENLAGDMRSMIMGATGLDALEANIGSLEQRLNENLMENILPGIQNRFGSTGTGAGSREGVFAAKAIGENQEALATGISQLMDRQQGRDLMGAGMMQDVFNLGISGFQGGAMPLMTLAQILGSPTVLAQSQGSGKGGGGSFSLFGG